MRILFASTHPYLPEMSGGVQSSTHELSVALRGLGHEVGVLAGLTGRVGIGLLARIRLKLGARVATDASCGYTVMRHWDPPSIADAVRDIFRPDVVVVQSVGVVRLAQAFQRLGVAVSVYLRNAEEESDEGDLAQLKDAAFIANSKFNSRFHELRYGVRSVVVPPLFAAEKYATAGGGSKVLFINPHPVKGLDRAVQIAKLCPQRSFLFLESWPLSNGERDVLREKIGGLANVSLLPRTPDMRTIYRQARVLIAPSSWNEAWGRVASEAHFSGIPVIGSDRGGLPEAIGPGGVVISFDEPAERWASEVERMFTDEEHWRQLSLAAFGYSRRPQLNPRLQVQEIERVLKDVVASAKNPMAP